MVVNVHLPLFRCVSYVCRGASASACLCVVPVSLSVPLTVTLRCLFHCCVQFYGPCWIAIVFNAYVFYSVRLRRCMNTFVVCTRALSQCTDALTTHLTRAHSYMHTAANKSYAAVCTFAFAPFTSCVVLVSHFFAGGESVVAVFVRHCRVQR